MTRREYRLTLRVVSPFMFESVVNSRVGFDAAYLRGEGGNPIIPAAQVKGVLRDALETLAEKTDLVTLSEINLLFGSPSTEIPAGERDRPVRGLAIIDDLQAPVAEASLQTTRIEIDDATGTVERGALQVIELAAPLGKAVDFSGTVVIRYTPSLDIPRIEKSVRAAISLIPAIGAYKTAGFGQVDRSGSTLVFVTDTSLTLQPTAASAQLSARFLVEFDRPLLVDTSRDDDNVFSSAAVITGAAFKGALAERLALAGELPERDDLPLGRALSQIRISHAFPIGKAGSPDLTEAELPIPRSIVFRKRGSEYIFADAIEAPGPGTGVLFDGDVAAPDFIATGKDADKSSFRETFNVPYWPDRLPRTHISMNEVSDSGGTNRRKANEEKNFTAEDHMLYSTAVLPVMGRTWRIDVDWSGVEDQELAAKLEGAFLQPLDGIGRTGATARFTPVPQPAESVVAPGHVDIMLVTPAVMFDPKTTTGQSMVERYTSYFRAMFGADIINFFAHQRMAGQYPAIRRRPYGETYYPFILTAPGSVFRLAVKDTEAAQKVQQALVSGLPVPPLNERPVTWKTCPFVPQNGYGEIRLHKSLMSAANWTRATDVTFVGEV